MDPRRNSGEMLQGEHGYNKDDRNAPSHLFDVPKQAALDYKKYKGDYPGDLSKKFHERIQALVEGREEAIFEKRVEIFSEKITEGNEASFPEDYKENQPVIRESREIVLGQMDRLITSRKYGEVIGKENPMPLRLVHPTNGKFSSYRSKLLKMAKDGSFDFNHVKHGAYGAVGFIDLPLNEGGESELACKYFNYAYSSDDKNFSKSEVTGVGQYVFSRYIQRDTPIQVPEPVFATNTLFIMESIKGAQTLREVLKTSPYKNEWQTWWNFMQNKVHDHMMKTLNGITDPYWRPDYKQVDLHTGNILIPPEWLHKKPPENEQDSYKCFYLIDPIR